MYAFAIHSMVHCAGAYEPGASGLLITAPPSVCVPDVIGALACGFQTKKKEKTDRDDIVHNTFS